MAPYNYPFYNHSNESLSAPNRTFLSQKEVIDTALSEILIRKGYKFHEVATVLRRNSRDHGLPGSIKYFYRIFEQAKKNITEPNKEAAQKKKPLAWYTSLSAVMSKVSLFFNSFLLYGKKLGSVPYES